MMILFRLLKCLTIWHEPLWLWIVGKHYARIEAMGGVNERAW
jgi:hypothetical protein